jgi:uncharacterized membrane protein
VAWLAAPNDFAEVGWWSVLAVVGSGFLASVLDSLLGATVQARYRDLSTGAETEQSFSVAGPNRLLRGWRWMNNDRVNLFATAAGAMGGLACFGAAIFAS